ncbi:MAG TPA: hypothetical protein VK175_08330 [Leadbetterella sp.]|jgi:hypothetical protein|nr:hypothetical protein [Leadbetterella sp.]
MIVDQLNAQKLPIIVVDKKLNALSKKVLAPKKMQKANEMLAAFGVPKK